MAISSRWLDALQEQFLAEQAASPYDPRFGVDEAPDLSGMRVMDAPAGQPGGSDLVGSSSGMSHGSGSYLDQVIAGGAAGGVGGGLAALFADPNADRGASGANAWDMFRGITKSLGRAIGSAYGNPNFGLAAQRADSEAAADSARLDAYRQQVAAQIENDLQSRREAAEKRAREARLVTAMQGIDPTTANGNAEAVRVATELGEYEVAAKLKGLLREEKPQSAPAGYRYAEDGQSLEAIPGGPADLDVVRSRSLAGRVGGRASSGGGGGSALPPIGVATHPDGTPINAWDTPALNPNDKQAAIAARTMGKTLETDSKDFITLQSAGRILNELEAANTPATEIATLYQFVKMLDPGSVVREGEIGLTTAGMAYFDRLGLHYKKTAEGGVVTPKMKADLIRTARGIYRAQLPAQIDREKRAFNVGAQLGVPPAALGGSRLTQEDWDQAYGRGAVSRGPSVPAGLEPTGQTSGGRPVYRTQDGKLVVVD